MRKLCPNFDREDGLDTVLEVPIPEEMFASKTSNMISWQNMKAWMTSSHPSNMTALFGGRNAEIQLLLGVVGAPLIPIAISYDHELISRNIKDHPIEASMAKYIVKQYTAAVGGEKALNSIESMYAMGKVRMGASEFCSGEKNVKAMKVKNLRSSLQGGEMGGFVLWQKGPELWCLELVVSGCKISAGSDGKVAWRQTPWHHSHASRGPPRPLRRFLQGLDPRSTANLFSNSVCVGEKAINDEDCFILKLEADSSTLKARSSNNVEIIRHTIWGYFSQRTGLLVQLEDSHLLRIKATGNNDNIFWETTMVSLIHDYRTIDGVNIAHSGKTTVSLFRFGENSTGHSRTRMEEVWEIEEVDFNIKGLSMECFLPPGDLKKEEEVRNDPRINWLCNPVQSFVVLPLQARNSEVFVERDTRTTSIDLPAGQPGRKTTLSLFPVTGQPEPPKELATAPLDPVGLKHMSFRGLPPVNSGVGNGGSFPSRGRNTGNRGIEREALQRVPNVEREGIINVASSATEETESHCIKRDLVLVSLTWAATPTMAAEGEWLTEITDSIEDNDIPIRRRNHSGGVGLWRRRRLRRNCGRGLRLGLIFKLWR
uniref:Uncharacterized protein n=1 Tax=Cannabis sativa TaxID=3483 RepID=A0A803QSG1_CANSA